jgi:hypothetical protein
MGSEQGRRLTCVRCGEEWIVHEVPYGFIDPARFHCGCETRAPEPETEQLSLTPRETTLSYDPSMAAIPF